MAHLQSLIIKSLDNQTLGELERHHTQNYFKPCS